MCKKQTYILKVSNRGTNVYESYLRTTYEVNIPNSMRNGKMSMISVIAGSIAIKTDNTTYHTINELGVQTNLPIMGFDTEVASGFSCQNFTTLFNVDLTSYHTNNINMPINITNSIGPFRCGSLPEKLTFQRYATTAGVKELFDTGSGNSDYISFTLSIEFDD
tara:strand:- start:624 stop:1112 length:489 start_codon:yes stop_codon:yes gene_type:complete